MVARYSVSNGALDTDFGGGVVTHDDTVHGPGVCPRRPELSMSRHLLRSNPQARHRRDVLVSVMSTDERNSGS